MMFFFFFYRVSSESFFLPRCRHLEICPCLFKRLLLVPLPPPNPPSPKCKFVSGIRFVSGDEQLCRQSSVESNKCPVNFRVSSLRLCDEEQLVSRLFKLTTFHENCLCRARFPFYQVVSSFLPVERRLIFVFPSSNCT